MSFKASHIAVIVAAGKGLRMGGNQKKQFMELAGVPVLIRTLERFFRHPRIHDIVLVVPESDIPYCKDLISTSCMGGGIHITSGGITRQESVLNGLKLAQGLVTDPGSTWILVHDGVRPFVPSSMIDALIDAARQTGAAIPVTKVTDTVKRVGNDGIIRETLDRTWLYQAQTPQVFRLDLGQMAYLLAKGAHVTGTDEAQILSHAGVKVATVPGSPTNIKLTTPQDLLLARFILSISPPITR